MGHFIRITLVVGLAIVAFMALVLLVKLLVVAALIAALAIGVAFVVRLLRGRRRLVLRGRVTRLTARR